MARVKICGMTDLRDALKACEFGADFLGFVFFAGSPRCIDADAAHAIIENLPKNVLKIGLFVNQELKVVREIGMRCRLDFIQLHGDEDRRFCREIKKDFKVIKSFKVKDERSIRAANGFEKFSDYFLFDTYAKDVPGGTGRTFNWEILKGKVFRKPFFLAGGLTPENVGAAIRKISPYAVDVASGVERSPGKKDYKLLKEFIDNAKKIA